MKGLSREASIPEKSTLTKNCVPVCYDNTFAVIRDIVTVGMVEDELPSTAFLLTTEALERKKYFTNCPLFNNDGIPALRY